MSSLSNPAATIFCSVSRISFSIFFVSELFAIGTADNFLAVKLDLMENSFDELTFESSGNNILQCVQDKFFNFFRIRTFCDRNRGQFPCRETRPDGEFLR